MFRESTDNTTLTDDNSVKNRAKCDPASLAMLLESGIVLLTQATWLLYGRTIDIQSLANAEMELAKRCILTALLYGTYCVLCT